MRQISVAKLKTECSALLDQLGPEGIIITKRGKPIAKLVPFSADPEKLIGSLSRLITIKGDILSTKGQWRYPR